MERRKPTPKEVVNGATAVAATGIAVADTVLRAHNVNIDISAMVALANVQQLPVDQMLEPIRRALKTIYEG